MMLVPYVEIDGSRTIPDSVLRQVHLKLLCQNLNPSVFINGAMKSHEEFISFLKDTRNLPIFSANFEGEVNGFAWLNEIKDTHASCHFCFFTETWGGKAEEIAREIIDYWFGFEDSGELLFDVLLG